MNTGLTPKQRFLAFDHVQQEVFSFSDRVASHGLTFEELDDISDIGWPVIDWSLFNDELLTTFVGAWAVSNENAEIISSIIANSAMREIESAPIMSQHHVNVGALAVSTLLASGDSRAYPLALDIIGTLSLAGVEYRLTPTEFFKGIGKAVWESQEILDEGADEDRVLVNLALTIRRHAAEAMQDEEFLSCIELDVDNFFS